MKTDNIMTAYEYEELRSKWCKSIKGDCDNCQLAKMKDGCSPFDEYQLMHGDRVKFLLENIKV